ncbi:hypothetical protein BJ138DRAFT_1149831 [Hygrophoropsis aurantiaca]|uniref:Uncharacterized protein n=1 Tax=Hygrophoropsis aurantiaca TaxID=72124 RepID=A0ACB8AFL6_9AGAM|nr:hypothetical protein BJ138DRAFT_1149831 [Hygrophoropsis aurantiaca]
MDWVSIFSPTPEPELQLFDGSADDHTFFKQSEGLHNHDVMLTQSSASALPINTPENVDPRLTNTLCIPTLYLEDEELELLGTPEPYEPAQLPSPQSEMMTFPFSPVPLQRLLPTQSLILTSNNHISDIKFDEELISESTSISAPTRSRQMAGLQSNDPLSPVGSTDTSRYTSARVLEKRKRNPTPSDIGDDEIFVGHDDDGDDDDDWKPSSSSTTHSVKRPRLKRNPAPARKAPPQRSAKRRGSTKSRASAGPKKIVCHNCGKRSFTRQHDLDRHLNTACSTLEQEKLPCKECSQRLSRFDALMRHYSGSHPHATRPTLNEVREYAEELQLKENRNFN